jgi:hypothetical protein
MSYRCRSSSYRMHMRTKNQESFLTTKEKLSLDGLTARSQPIQRQGGGKGGRQKKNLRCRASVSWRRTLGRMRRSRARPNLNHTADPRRGGWLLEPEEGAARGGAGGCEERTGSTEEERVGVGKRSSSRGGSARCEWAQVDDVGGCSARRCRPAT